MTTPPTTSAGQSHSRHTHDYHRHIYAQGDGLDDGDHSPPLIQLDYDDQVDVIPMDKARRRDRPPALAIHSSSTAGSRDVDDRVNYADHREQDRTRTKVSVCS